MKHLECYNWPGLGEARASATLPMIVLVTHGQFCATANQPAKDGARELAK
jgi:hypothetical protein